MNFLCIKQILTIMFTLKIIFHLLFLGFSNSWTERIKTRECRGLGAINPQTQNPYKLTTDCFPCFPRALMQNELAKGYQPFLAVRS
jgi:hypothetical protein